MSSSGTDSFTPPISPQGPPGPSGVGRLQTHCGRPHAGGLGSLPFLRFGWQNSPPCPALLGPRSQPVQTSGNRLAPAAPNLGLEMGKSLAKHGATPGGWAHARPRGAGTAQGRRASARRVAVPGRSGKSLWRSPRRASQEWWAQPLSLSVI